MNFDMILYPPQVHFDLTENHTSHVFVLLESAELNS